MSALILEKSFIFSIFVIRSMFLSVVKYFDQYNLPQSLHPLNVERSYATLKAIRVSP